MRKFENAKIFAVLLCYPSVEKETIYSFFRMIEYSKEKNDITWDLMNDRPQSFARQRAINHTLEMDFDHLFMVDRDHIFNYRTLEWMYEIDKDIVGAIAVRKVDRFEERNQFPTTNVFDKLITPEYPFGISTALTVPELRVRIGQAKEEPFKVNRVGSGMILIKRKVLETISKPHFAESIDENSPSQQKETMGNDIYFSKKATEAGFEMWVNPEVSIIHIGKSYSAVGLK